MLNTQPCIGFMGKHARAYERHRHDKNMFNSHIYIRKKIYEKLKMYGGEEGGIHLSMP